MRAWPRIVHWLRVALYRRTRIATRSPQMPTCKQTIAANCSLSDAFEYVADLHNLQNYLPMFVSVKPVSLVHYGPGASFEAVIGLARTEIMTTLDVVEFQKNRRLVARSVKGIKLRITWELKESGPRTIIVFVLDYEVPSGLIVRKDEAEGIAKDVETVGCKSMELLKWILENLPKGEGG